MIALNKENLHFQIVVDTLIGEENQRIDIGIDLDGEVTFHAKTKRFLNSKGCKVKSCYFLRS